MDVQGIILAAGLSSRAKTFKMTLTLNSSTVIENTIRGMLEFCTRIYVVGGYQIERLQPIVKHYNTVELLHNESYRDGMYSSVKKGISAVSAPRFFITPGDYPMISKQVYQELLKYKAPVAIPSFEGRRGHPILTESEAVRRVMAEGEYTSLREVIGKLDAVIVPVNSPGVVMDIDTMEDYELMQKYFREGVSI